MIYSDISFKKKLVLAALFVLASLSYPREGLAMELEYTRKSTDNISPPSFTSEKDFENLIEAAKQNDVNAQDKLMLLYFYAEWCRDALTPENIGFLRWTAQNTAKSLETLFVRADYYVFYAIGKIQLSDYVLQDLVGQITARANQGNALSQATLGGMYHEGWGVGKDEKEAFRLFKLAADQGLVPAQSELGNRYSDGRGVKQNAFEGLHWFIKSKKKLMCRLRGLSLNPKALISNCKFQDIVSGDTFSLALLNLYTKDKRDRGLFTIPEPGKVYESDEAFSVLESLRTIKPGFMVTVVTLSQDMEIYLPQQITPFFSIDKINENSYLTMGEENVKVTHKVVEFFNKLKIADEHLENTARLYEKGLESVLQGLLAGIKEEREFLCNLQKLVKSTIHRGVGSRNKDLLESEEYGFLGD